MIKAMLEQELGAITDEQFKKICTQADKELKGYVKFGFHNSLNDCLNIASTFLGV